MNETKILLVDDEQKILDIFTKQLVNLGHFSVDTALGGIPAIEKLTQNKYDILLLDLMMEDKDGIEVLKEMKQLPNQPKVIILTNLVSEEQKKVTSDLGVFDYIIKTDIDPTTLISKINQLMGNENNNT